MRRIAMIALALSVQAASATTVIAMAPAEVFDRAATSVLGEVVSVEAKETNEGVIFTEVKLKVEECFFSKEVDKIGEEYRFDGGYFVFRHWGGVKGDRKLLIHGSPTFEVGERVLVALEDNPSGEARFCVGLAQGKYRIEGDRAIREMGGLQLLDPEAGTVAEGETDETPVKDLVQFVRTRYNRAAPGEGR